MPDPITTTNTTRELLVVLVIALAPASALSLVLSALLERSGPIRLRHWAEEAGGQIRSVYDDTARFEVLRFLLNLGARLLLLALLLVLLGLFGQLEITLGGLSVFLVVVVLAAAIELLNRSLVGHDPEPVLRRLTGIYRGVVFFLRPLLSMFASLVPRRRGDDSSADDDEEEISEEEIEAFIDVGKREGILEGPEEQLVRGVVDFSDTLVRSVMTPRTEMIAAPVESSLEQLADLFVDSRHTRLPLYAGSVDQVVGILHIRDLLAGLRTSPRTTALELAKTPFVVPETKPLSELLTELQSRHLQLALVVDEYGGISGLVTIEDLLEQIVGDIVDEHEELPQLYEVLDNGRFRLDGRAPVDVLEDLFGIDTTEDESETVGGLVFTALGTVPNEGDVVEVHGLRFVVVGVDQRRVSRVEVARRGSEDEVLAPVEAAGSEGRALD